ncbi:winged helix-turn-helix transcriptional regulator [Leifsonia shinshuensis]|uniref:DNA-binding HxlR family transcriptional regulator n=1 Tax=Leifsonia shinshuensis TaxID=150026 RepID=A0A853CRH6_9MICO|nr:helix-turn-helix domain-containing protein [Leifsonia shinshuensis]NYJ22938.1 DNA-binding HxlR family transcriptional regulator [Leifsonia shinshuensis]
MSQSVEKGCGTGSLTAEQRRLKAQRQHNAHLGACPARQLLEAISSKWVTLVMLALEDGQLRHSELRKRIPGASQKMLTSTLRSLERDGLVSRHVTASVPVRTDYELTLLGQSLLRIVFEMKNWAETNMDEVAASRAEHDTHRLQVR